MKKTAIVFAVFLLVANIAGCSLLPKEEEVREEDEATQEEMYKTAVAARQDMDIYAVITCNYVAEDEIGMGFEAEGLPFGKTYVSVGDKVEKGQILAELDLGTYATDKKAYEASLEKLQMQENYLQDMVYYEQLKSQVGKHAYSEAKENITGLQSELTSVRQQEAIVNVQIAEADREIKKRQIRAPKKGVITAIDEKLKGGEQYKDETSKSGIDVIKMTDKSFCYVADTDLYENFSKGDRVNMNVNGKNIKMKIRKIESIQDEQVNPDSGDGDEQGDKKRMYLDFDGEVSQLDAFVSGNINELIDSRRNVLAVPAQAIVKMEDKNYVYVVGKDDMREIREVEIGASDGNSTEIVSGIDEGTQVILK